MPYDPLLMAKMRTQAQQSADRADGHDSKPAGGGGNEVAARNVEQSNALLADDDEEEDEDEEVPPPPPPEETPVVAPPIKGHRRNMAMASPIDLGNLEKPEEEAIPPPPPTHRRGGAISSARDLGMSGRELGELAKPEEIPPPPPTHRRGAAIGGGFTPPRADIDFDSSNVKQDVMMGKMLRKEKLERNRELEALGGGKADTFRGHDAAGRDMRILAEDPRFQKRYEFDRPEDKGSNAVSRKLIETKGKISKVGDKVSNWWANRGNKKKKKDTGEPSLKQKGKEYAARNLLQKVPVVGAGMKFAAGYKEHKRAKVDDEVAADTSQDNLTRAVGAGLAQGHRGQRNKEVIGGAVSVVKTAVDVGTHGLSALTPDIPHIGVPDMPNFGGGLGHGAGHGIGDRVHHASDVAQHGFDKAKDKASEKIHDKLQPDALAETAGEQGVKRGGPAGIKKLEQLFGDGEKLEPHKLRQQAIAPVAATPHVVEGGDKSAGVLAAQKHGAAEQQTRNEAGVDKSNEAMLKLTVADPKMGAAVLNHLHANDGLDETAGMKGIAANLAQAREMDPATTKKVGTFGSRKTVTTEHNLKPSQIAAMVRGDGARKRQAARMGGMEGTLGKLTKNEKRGWWEAGAGTDVHVPKKEAPAPVEEAPKKDEEEAEDEAEA